MKTADIADKTEKELGQMITDQRSQLAKLAVDFRTKSVTNVKQIKLVKRDLARALTLQRERQITSQESKDE